jgi:hypothetical protein
MPVRFFSSRKGLVVALGAALVLVLQTLAGAVAFGAGPERVDLFGNALCITDASSPAPGPLHDGHAKMLADCCTAGCPMFAAMLAGPGAPTFQQRLLSGKTLAAGDDAGAASARRHEPGNPRAPPLTA